ncbi:SusC/RagA family TonB-linked outer membrane protein [Arachidicoccus sp.]|uniref:SusC/RagA family TonB-linked outer membrane protein n=1 Tax=Arachidicoccus sp. TaxID=1872624 RepID=UPI003D22F6D4
MRILQLKFFKSCSFLLLLLLFTMPGNILFAQSQKSISGTVTGSSGRAAEAVTINVKGTKRFTTSGPDGSFSIIASNGDILVFSGLTFKTREVLITDQVNYQVVMEETAASLGDVVVVGYGTGSRKTLTSSISSLKGEDMNKGAITDVGQLLQGKVPGLNITASGDPNRPAAIILRGASTINSSQSPYYVIDGVPGADISLVSPNDIASIDVLKDAAATAIYGNRGANGIIIITTKKGKKGDPSIDYNSYVGVEKVSNKLDLMDSAQLRSFLRKNSLALSPNDDLGANTDWQAAVERNQAISHSENMSISGGSDHGNYIASVTYTNKEGIIQSSNLSRLIAHLAVEQYAINNKVKVGFNLTNSISNANNVPNRNVVLQQSILHLPVSPVRNADGSFFENFNNTGYFNPLALIDHAQDNTKFNNLVGAFTVEVKLPFGLKYNLDASYQRSNYLHGEFYDSYYSKYNSANFYSNPEPPATHSLINFGVNGSALRSSYQNETTTIEDYLTWDKKIGDHGINLVAGYSWQQNSSGDGFQATTTNLAVDNIGFYNLALSNYTAVTGYVVNFGADGVYNKTKFISDFARLNYNFREKYLLQASIRRDGSSVFGANHQWGYFPSIGAAWRIDKEAFMANQRLFSNLKLRLSYGVTGNATGFSAYTAQFISGSLGTYYYNGSTEAAYGPTQAENPDLKWEKTATKNIGVDFGFLKGVVTGSIDVYDKNTTGMIYSYSVDPILIPSGSIVANGGSMSNKGVEFSLNASVVNHHSFTWTTGINLAHNKNEITSLNNPLFTGGDSVRLTQPDGGGQTGSTLQILKAGRPLGQFFTLQYAGKNSNGISQYVAADGSLTTTPSIGTDYHYAGSPQPKLIAGWANTFRYKNFDLNVFLRGSFGGKIFNVARADLFRPSTAQYTNILTDVANESINDVNAFKYSTRFIESGSFIRLDNATLGYNFSRLGRYIKRCRIYATVNNLFVITKYKGIDPEINQGGNAPGIDSDNFYPKTRTLLFGLNINL